MNDYFNTSFPFVMSPPSTDATYTMWTILIQHIGHTVNIFTVSGGQINGTIVELLGATTGGAVLTVSDRFASKHYVKLADISHFWCDADKPSDDQ